MATDSKSKVTTLDDPKPAAVNAAIDATEIQADGRDAELSGETVMLTIFPSADELGQEAVFLGHNSYAYQIPRGKPFRVPREVAQVVADAVVDTFKPGADGQLVKVSTPRYAFSITQ